MPEGRTTWCLKQSRICLALPLRQYFQTPTRFFQHLSSPPIKHGQYCCCSAKTKLRASASCFFFFFFYEVDITDVSGYQLHKASVFSHGGPGAQLGHEHRARLPFLGGSVLQSWCCQTGRWGGEKKPKKSSYCCWDCRSLCGELCTAEEIAACGTSALNRLFAPALR